MSDILFKCPTCAKHLVIDEAAIGQSVNCTDCGTRMQVPQPAGKFTCPSCMWNLSAPASFVGQTFHCPNCETEIAVPVATTSNDTPAKKRLNLAPRIPPGSRENAMLSGINAPGERPAPPRNRQQSGEGGTIKVISLACQNCGGQLQYSASTAVARCLFCGSDSLVQTPNGSTGGAAGGDDDPPAYYEPNFSATQIRDAIIKKASVTPTSLKTLDQVSMKVECCYFPAWATHLQVHCNWGGENISYHTVTRYRKDSKWVPDRSAALGGSFVEVDVPYEDTEETRHPASGMHDYETTIHIPAAKGITPEQFDLLCRGASGVAMLSGIPSSWAKFSVALPTFRGADAWKVISGNALLERDATNACSGYCDRINKVGPVVNSRRFSLVWLPMAVASYTVQGQEYRHFASLITGEFWGDIPADYSAVRQEALRVKAEMAKLRKQNIALGLGCLGLAGLCGPGAIYFLVRFADASSDSGPPFGWLFLGCLVVALGCLAIGIGSLVEVLTAPWVSFLRNHYAFLARFFLDPPNHLKQRMYEGYVPAELEKLKAGVRDALECNFANDWLRNYEDNNWTRFEAIVTRAADVMIDQPATAMPYKLNLYHVPGKGCTTDFSEVDRWREEVAARR